MSCSRSTGRRSTPAAATDSTRSGTERTDATTGALEPPAAGRCAPRCPLTHTAHEVPQVVEGRLRLTPQRRCRGHRPLVVTGHFESAAVQGDDGQPVRQSVVQLLREELALRLPGELIRQGFAALRLPDRNRLDRPHPLRSTDEIAHAHGDRESDDTGPYRQEIDPQRRAGRRIRRVHAHQGLRCGDEEERERVERGGTQTRPDGCPHHHDRACRRS